MGCTDSLGRGVGAPPSVFSRVGSKLPLPLYADVRLHIPMTHRNAAENVTGGITGPPRDAQQQRPQGTRTQFAQSLSRPQVLFP